MAMAGMDYRKCGVSLEEYLNPHCPQQPPLYLEAECNGFLDVDVEYMKAKLREWAKAVASKQEDTVFHVKNMKCNIHAFS